MKSSQHLARLLRLVPFLVARQGVSASAAAEAFGVSPQQIIRDIEVLQFCGLPGGYYDDLFDVDIDVVRSEGIIFFNNAEVLARPLRLRPEEAVSLLAALRLVEHVAGESEAASSALAKLSAVVGGIGPQVSVCVTSLGEPSHRVVLAGAIERGHAVRLDYRTPERDGLSTAVVEPLRLCLVDGVSYLEGWSRPREAWRTYRLDRIDNVTELDESVTRRGEPPTWFEDPPAELTLTLRRRAMWITEYVPTMRVRSQEESIEVTLPVGSLSWAARLVLRLGDDVIAVSDPAVTALVRERAAAALRLYD